MADLVVSEVVQVIGTYGKKSADTMVAEVQITFREFTAQPNEMSAGMTFVAQQQLQNSVHRLLEKAKNVPRGTFMVVLPVQEAKVKPKPKAKTK